MLQAQPRSVVVGMMALASLTSLVKKNNGQTSRPKVGAHICRKTTVLGLKKTSMDFGLRR